MPSAAVLPVPRVRVGFAADPGRLPSLRYGPGFRAARRASLRESRPLRASIPDANPLPPIQPGLRPDWALAARRAGAVSTFRIPSVPCARRPKRDRSPPSFAFKGALRRPRHPFGARPSGCAPHAALRPPLNTPAGRLLQSRDDELRGLAAAVLQKSRHHRHVPLRGELRILGPGRPAIQTTFEWRSRWKRTACTIG